MAPETIHSRPTMCLRIFYQQKHYHIWPTGFGTGHKTLRILKDYRATLLQIYPNIQEKEEWV